MGTLKNIVIEEDYDGTDDGRPIILKWYYCPYCDKKVDRYTHICPHCGKEMINNNRKEAKHR